MGAVRRPDPPAELSFRRHGESPAHVRNATILAGDKSLVGLIAHELAHSWSGNLVTNATWRDFWLNEGFTVYFERRIQEEVYGLERSEMEALIEKQELVKEMADLPDKDEILYVDLKGRDPDDGFTQVPYVKGMLFLRRLEEVFGRERFDTFLRGYFNQFAFKSIVTGDFVDYLQRNLLEQNRELASEDQCGGVAHAAGPTQRYAAAKIRCLQKTEAAAKQWMSRQTERTSLPVKSWTTQEWLHFLRSLPPEPRCKAHGGTGPRVPSDAVGQFRNSGGMAADVDPQRVSAGLSQAGPFLWRWAAGNISSLCTRNWRRRPEGKAHAKAVYAKARPGYHPIAVTTMDDLLK